MTVNVLQPQKPENTITLAEAVCLRPIIGSRIGELIRERQDASTVTYKVGEEPVMPTRTVADITIDLANARSDYHTVAESPLLQIWG